MNSPLLNVMSAAAVKAGKGLLRDFNEVDHLHISRKGSANFVTSADLRTEKLLQKELAKARPEFGFLMEESGEVQGKSDMRWIIDPVDGTTNFIHAIPYFCISIAAEKRTGDKSEILAGVIFDPIHNELFTAERGKGAFLNSRKLSVSSREKPEDAMLVFSNHRFLPEQERARAFGLYDALSQCGATVRHFGATALDLANLASGRIDACVDYTIKPWDIAAGMLLVQEAGGQVTRIDGSPADAYATNLLSSNRHLHPAMQKLLRAA